MKNILYIIFAVFFVISCTKDDSLDPRPDLVPGQFVKIDFVKSRIDSNNLSTSAFQAVISTPSNNVDKYELYVAHRNGFGFVSDFVLLETITSFPYNLSVTSAKIQGAGLPALSTGDILRFSGKSYKNGVLADFNSLSSILKGSQAHKQAYKFYTDVTTTPLVVLDNQYTW